MIPKQILHVSFAEVAMRPFLIVSSLILLVLPVSVGAQTSGKPAFQRGYLHSQFVKAADGGVDMLWVKLSAAGHDLFLARRSSAGALQNPVKVNTSDGDVMYLPPEQARPAVAAGPGGAVGVAWFDKKGQLMVGISRDKGRSFGPSVAVDPGNARPEQAFADVAFDASGTMFVIWIDVRDAPVGSEEPAQLYIARIDNDTNPTVANLTGSYTTSICGCCRPDLYIKGRDITASFRMAGADGYRDIYRSRTGSGLTISKPELMGGQMWKLAGCPMAGPVSIGEFTWFLDGSTGVKRLMEASSPTATAVPVAAATVANPRSPRLVIGSEERGGMIYLPGKPYGQVLLRDSGSWRVLVEDVPYFCTDMALVDGQLLMVGDKDGGLWMEATALK
jgi:hypothetical protein